MYCVKSQDHDGQGGHGGKVLIADYEYGTKDVANEEVRRIALEQMVDGERIIHIDGMSTVLHANEAYTLYWRSGDE